MHASSVIRLVRRRLSLPFATLVLLATMSAPHPAGAGAIPSGLTLRQVADLGARIVAVRHAADASGRLFVVKQQGQILIYRSATATLLAEPFLDIAPLVDDSGNEQGLLGLAFHPNFVENGQFFVNYTRDPGPGKDRTVVARYSVSAGNPDRADPASATVLLEVEQDFGNHNGGDMHFGPDGYLYIGMGDGGSGGDPNNRAQDPGSLLGKILRIDVDSPTPTEPHDLCGLNPRYGIPADNPFAGGSGDCDEVWASGLRNPWRWSFDRQTGDMLIGDVGQNAVEEIDLQPAGVPALNYGWRCREGDQPFNASPPCTAPLTEPIITYTHTEGCSVTGGYRYRGSIQALRGTYLYADFCSGRIWFATQSDTGGWTTTEWQDTSINVSSFGEDELGEIYLADIDGSLYTLLRLPENPVAAARRLGSTLVAPFQLDAKTILRLANVGPRAVDVRLIAVCGAGLSSDQPAACGSAARDLSVGTLTPRVIDVQKFFDLDASGCAAGFVLVHAENDDVDANQAIAWNFLTASVYFRDNGPGKLRAAGSNALAFQSPNQLGTAIGSGGASPELPFDGVALLPPGTTLHTDFRALSPGAFPRGSVLHLFALDVQAGSENPPTSVSVDWNNQAGVPFSTELQFVCHVRTPLDQIPGAGDGFTRSGLGSAFGRITIVPGTIGAVLGFIEELENNRWTLRALSAGGIPNPAVFVGH